MAPENTVGVKTRAMTEAHRTESETPQVVDKNQE